MKQFLVISVLAVSFTASADLLTCANSEATMTYSHRTSNGGAPLDIQTLTIHDVTQVQRNYNEPAVEFNLTNQKVISVQKHGPAATTTIFVATAEGKVTDRNGTEQSLADVVICKENKGPICATCP